MDTLEIKTKIQIAKTPGEVFEAIVDPEHMSNYFIAKGSGRLDANTEVIWNWPEFEGDFPVRCGRTAPGRYISFYWKNGDRETLVEMTLEPAGDNATVITTTEKSMPNDEAGMKWLKGNTEGWANFNACLKAWMEYGINLRKVLSIL